MQSERRHELQTNALADWLGRRSSESALPNKPAGRRPAAAMLAVAGAWWESIRRSSPPRRGRGCLRAIRTCCSASWNSTAASRSARWRRWSPATILFSQGVQQRFTNRARRQREPGKARSCYTARLAVNPSPMAKERATLARPRARNNEQIARGRAGVQGRQGEMAARRVCRMGLPPPGGPGEAGDEGVLRRVRPIRSQAEPRRRRRCPGKSSFSKPDTLQEPAEEPLFKPGERLKLEGDEKESKGAATPAKPLTPVKPSTPARPSTPVKPSTPAQPSPAAKPSPPKK